VAESPGRVRWAFGSRFFVGLILGLIWIGPGWLQWRFLWGMAAWDAVLLVAWFIDWRRLPPGGAIEVSLIWSEPLTQGRPSSTALEVRNRSRLPLHVVLEDDLPPSLFVDHGTLTAEVPAATIADESDRAHVRAPGRAHCPYTILPRERGDVRLGPVSVRYSSSLRLAERWAAADITQRVRVYPDLQESKRLSFYLMRSRQVELEKRFRRQIGTGREFDRLREYRTDDEMRSVCWTATARRGKLITKVFRVERSQPVLIVIDQGRLMLARTRPHRTLGAASTQGPLSDPAALKLSKLDYAVTAALSLAEVVLYSGDSVGLLTYGRKLSGQLKPGRGHAHLRTLLENLAVLRGEMAEADHAMASSALARGQRRRSLVVWLTDIAETAATPEVIEAASRLLNRHLVLFVAIGSPDLQELIVRRSASTTDMYRYAAATEVIERREVLLRGLRQRGALIAELMPGQLAGGLISRYLEVKERSLL
jgi:uncharacterized protein (DUF58 family)